MKLKEGFVLREVAGEMVVLPSGENLDLSMIITLNGTGAFLWEQLQKDCDENGLVQALLSEYDVDEKTARTSVTNFVKELFENELLAD